MSLAEELGRAAIGELVSAALEWVEHLVARDKARDLEARVREVVRAAIAWAFAAQLDAQGLVEAAKQRAHDRLEALGVKLTRPVLALVDHAFDVVIAELAEKQLALGLGQLPAAYGKVMDAFSPKPGESLGPLGGGRIQFEQVTPEEMAKLKADDAERVKAGLTELEWSERKAMLGDE